jgi:tetrahydromethanopterin S-methyltransferase subunit G
MTNITDNITTDYVEEDIVEDTDARLEALYDELDDINREINLISSSAYVDYNDIDDQLEDLEDIRDDIRYEISQITGHVVTI